MSDDNTKLYFRNLEKFSNHLQGLIETYSEISLGELECPNGLTVIPLHDMIVEICVNVSGNQISSKEDLINYLERTL